jgi:serine/threonine protein kinase
MEGGDEFLSGLNAGAGEGVARFGIMVDDTILEQVKQRDEEGTNHKEGGSGNVSKMLLTLGNGQRQPFYVKEVRPQDVNDKSEGQLVNEIKNIYNEITININLTASIPEFMSRCAGAYIRYEKARALNYSAFIIYEFLPGYTLKEYFFKKRREPTLAQGEVDLILGSLRRCLDALHGSGYVHRDIKPDNVFLVTDSTKTTIEKCILIDFGETLRIGQTLDIDAREIKGDYEYNPYVEDYETGKVVFPWIRAQTPATPEQDNYAFMQIYVLPRPNGFGLSNSDNVGQMSQEASQPASDPYPFPNSQGGRRKKKNTRRRKNKRRNTRKRL